MPLYFAYGSNMDVKTMSERCPRSRPLGRARLARHRLFFMREGFANVAPDPRATVHGVLWELALADVHALDAYEEVGRGLYAKCLRPVLREPLGSARALIYVGRTQESGTPLEDYFARVVAAAREWELPAPYIAYLELFGREFPGRAKAERAP
jgi:gamma-glutamylcyclotransferase (GGCT)/AIG2-like uncharacterized protein YtfP